jgi:hypothetical protein
MLTKVPHTPSVVHVDAHTHTHISPLSPEQKYMKEKPMGVYRNEICELDNIQYMFLYSFVSWII